MKNYCFLPRTPTLSWIRWFHSEYGLNFNQNPPARSFLWNTVRKFLPSLRDISFVLANNCNTTFFWLNSWLTSRPLAITHPHLFSHSTHQSVLVCQVMQNGLLANLRDR